jgi:hypothetical protein
MKRLDFLRLVVVAPWALRHVAAGCGTDIVLDPRFAAVSWLLKQQSSDGAWRSETYGAFRDGRALTPVVLRALANERAAEAACRKACAWLLENREALLEEYPVHLASAILESSVRLPNLKPLIVAAKDRLLELRCRESGGWSYSTAMPPTTGDLSPMQQPNLAATVMAIDGLRAAGLLADDPVLRKALAFVLSCQNYGHGEFDDGGFFQMADDPARNKAGIAGTDREGRVRYRSYASATSDGVRALLICGQSHSSLRVQATKDWLQSFPDRNPADLKYYTARSLAKSGLLSLGLLNELAAGQAADGSFRNPAGEMREDCPVVATALMLEALAG